MRFSESCESWKYISLEVLKAQSLNRFKTEVNIFLDSKEINKYGQGTELILR